MATTTRAIIPNPAKDEPASFIETNHEGSLVVAVLGMYEDGGVEATLCDEFAPRPEGGSGCRNVAYSECPNSCIYIQREHGFVK